MSSVVLFSKEVNMNKDIKTIRTQAAAHFLEGDFERSQALYQQLLQLSPDDPLVSERMGTLALYHNRVDEAIDWYEKSLSQTPWYDRVWPFSASLHYRLALAHYRKNSFHDAALHFEKAAGPFGCIAELDAFHKNMKQFEKLTPYRTEGPRICRIEFDRIDPLPVLRLSVNGSEPEYFIVDTGGCEIIVDHEFAMHCNIELAGSFNAGYAGNKKGKTHVGKADRVSIGDFIVHDVPVWTLDVSSISKLFDGLPIRGIVGTRFLLQYISTIDYRNGALILRQKNDQNYDEFRREIAKNSNKRIPMYLCDTHYMLARGKINNLTPMLFFVDTGLAAKGFTATENLLNRAGITPDWSTAQNGYGGGGKIESVDFTVDYLSLGSAENLIEKCNVSGCAIRNDVSVFGTVLGFRLEALVSHTFFKDQRISFDYDAMEMIVE